MAEAALEAVGLSKRYGSLAVTRDVSLALAPGEMLALIGPNGAGKTTLVGQLSGRIRPNAGRVRLEGRDVTGLSLAERARAGLVQSFQVPSLFGSFSVFGNVALSVQARLRPRGVRPLRPGGTAPDVVEPARATMARVGIAAEADRPVSALSHGERRYVELALTLAQEPRVLLLDEPLAGLSRAETERMVRFLADLKGRFAVLLIEHDMEAVFALADRVAVLVEGALLTTGTPDAVRASRLVQEAYLGDESLDALPEADPADPEAA
jgi:branched-chain amino acid transport system ATP-binding protein